MRKSLGTLALILLVITLIGLHRDWFDLDRKREGNTTEVHLRIDREKIRNDTREAAETARELGSNVEVKIKQDEEQAVTDNKTDRQEPEEQWR